MYVCVREFSYYCHSLLWLKATLVVMSQRVYLQHIAETVHYDWSPQYLRCHREAICNLLQPQFNMAEGHSIWDVTGRRYATYYSQSSIWLKDTVFRMSQRGYMQPIADTVHYDWRPQYLRCHREAICNLLQPQFNMVEGHSIWVSKHG